MVLIALVCEYELHLFNNFITKFHTYVARSAYLQFFLILFTTLLCSPNGYMNNIFSSFIYKLPEINIMNTDTMQNYMYQ